LVALPDREVSYRRDSLINRPATSAQVLQEIQGPKAERLGDRAQALFFCGTTNRKNRCKAVKIIRVRLVGPGMLRAVKTAVDLLV
jgi:hypothetical protein